MIALLQPGVRDDEIAVIEDVVRDQSVDEAAYVLDELGRLGVELLHGALEPVAERDAPPAEGAVELGLVVAGDAERVAGADHAHDEPQHAGGVGAAIDQVADEHRTSAVGVAGIDGAPGVIAYEVVAQLGEQLLELEPAAVHVADDVERTVLVAEVVHQLLAHERRGLDLLDRPEDVDGAEPLTLEALERAPELVVLPLDDVGAEVPVGACGVALDADAGRQVQHHGDRQDVVRLGERDEALAGAGLHVRRVDDRQPAQLEPLADDELQDLERVLGRGLVVLVVGDQPAAEVARDDLGRLEVLGGERRLARAAHSDQDDERGLRYAQCRHEASSVRVKSASCVAGPTSSSTGPTGRCSMV